MYVGTAYSSDRDLTFSVPQGSCAGPHLYLAYASTLQEVIPQTITIHGFADDHAIKISYPAGNTSAESQTLQLLNSTLKDINNWMGANRLKVNNNKTEFIIFGSEKMLKTTEVDSLDVNGETITRSRIIKYLGAYLDAELNLKTHVANKCKIAMLNIRRIRNIRSFLTMDASKVFMSTLVQSHMDYVNAIFIGLPEITIRKMQRIQNIAAKIVLNRDRNSSATACLIELHWLPTASRIKYKTLVLVYCLGVHSIIWVQILKDLPACVFLAAMGTFSIS